MDRDKKLTLGLFLTWVVFGLFNLFGQPQAFVPPIIVDGVLVAGLGIYFLFPFRNNPFYFSLALFTLLILLLALMETNWITVTENWQRIILLTGIIFCLALFIAGLWMLAQNKMEGFLSLLVSALIGLGFMFLLKVAPVASGVYMILYASAGILTLGGLLLSKNQSTSSISFRRIFLVLLLNLLFDIGNYLALLALA